MQVCTVCSKIHVHRQYSTEMERVAFATSTLLSRSTKLMRAFVECGISQSFNCMLQQEKILMVVSGAFCDNAKLGLCTYVLDQLGSTVSSYMYILNWVVAVQRKNLPIKL